MEQEKPIFERMLEGGIIRNDDPQFFKIFEQVAIAKSLSVQLNNAINSNEIRAILGKIIDKKVDETTTVFTPFHTNFGLFISIGKNVLLIMLAVFWIWGALLLKTM